MVTQICEIPDSDTSNIKPDTQANDQDNKKAPTPKKMQPTSNTGKPACMFCRRQQSRKVTVFELTFRNTKKERTFQEYYCKDCLNQLKDLVARLTDIPEMPEPAFSKYEKHIGQTLKEFLCTPTYLNANQEIIFYDKRNQEIKEFTEWLTHTIYNITDEFEYLKVVLNE